MFRWDPSGNILLSRTPIVCFSTHSGQQYGYPLAEAIGVILGLFLALMRMSHYPFLTWPALRLYLVFSR